LAEGSPHSGRVADIGCDHGYLVRHLLSEGIADFAVASDIREGPLKAASETLGVFTADKVSLRLGDGLSVLESGEITCCIIAGMGGMNIVKILKSKPEVTESMPQFILSPERDCASVRRHLHVCGFYIEEEILTEEGGRFYFALDARRGNEAAYTDAEYLFGARLIERKDDVLHRFLLREYEKNTRIKESFVGKPAPDGVLSYLAALVNVLDNFK
jgi:tRNA (adenine22-N1)-methyltransferase